MRKLPRLHYLPSFLVILLYGLLIANKFAIESQGSLIDYYRNISPDGFDWISQAEQLSNHLFHGSQITQVPLLRDPGFTFALSIDHVLGGNGIVLGLIQGFSFIAINSTIIYFANLMSTSPEIRSRGRMIADNLFYCAIVIGNPLNWVYSWILAEPLAVFASLVPVALLIRNRKNWHTATIWMGSAFIAGLASLIQTYAFIPFICTTFFSILEQLHLNIKRPNFRLPAWNIASLLICFAISFGGKAIWRAMILHDSVPESFSLLKPSLDMVDFYWHTWTYAFLLPLAVLALTLLNNTRKIIARKPIYRTIHSSPTIAEHSARVLILLAFITLCLASLCLFYQWKESRFSFIMYPYVAALAITGFRNLTEGLFRPNKKPLVFALFLLTSCTLIFRLDPVDIWRPSLTDASVQWIDFPLPLNDESRNLSCPLLGEASGFKDAALKDPYLTTIIRFRERLCVL